ncbi:MAG TPA: exonuclease domain-containing protein [Bacteroidia bacterium]
MQLNLTKPIAFIDLETTGINVGSDRIVEISILKVHTNGEQEVKTLRVNPGMPIPAESSRIHHIFDADVKDCQTFKQLAPQLASFIEGCDLAGYNSNKFDIPLLAEEFLRAEVDFDLRNRRLVDVQNIFHIMEQRTLSAAYKFYCEKEIENAHSAEADIKATYEVFLAQLEKYKEVEMTDEKGNKYFPVTNNIEALSKLTNRTRNADLAGRIQFNAKGQEVFAFGKHKDKPVEEIFEKEPSYYTWMMDGDFPLYTKKIITQIRLRMKMK